MKKRTPKETAYYAHAMCMYGRNEECLHLDVIKLGFPTHGIINPGEYNNHPAKRRDTLGFCFKLIDKADVLVFSRLLGKITAGVGAEINYALRNQKPVYELKCGMREWDFIEVKKPVKYLSREATLDLYWEYRLRQLSSCSCT